MHRRSVLYVIALGVPLATGGCVAADPGYIGLWLCPGTRARIRTRIRTLRPGPFYGSPPPPDPVVVPGRGIAVIGLGDRPEHHDRDRPADHDHDRPHAFSESRLPRPTPPP